MSKEMTPKQALRRISSFISFCCYEYFDKELEKDWKKDIDAINQALDRLELLEKENQEVKEKVKKYDEIVNLKTTPNVIEKSLADYMNKCIDLEKENQELTLLNETQANIINELQQHRNSVENQNASLKIKVRAWEIQGEKFKKAIDVLKDKANIRLHILTNTDGSKIYEIEFIFTYYSTIHEITQQEYDLLKEFLENGGN